MVFLTLFTLGIGILGTAYWFFTRRSEESTTALFAKRNVRYIAQPNAFLQVLKKQRLEIPRHEIIKREGKTFGFNFLGLPTILTAEPDIAQLVLSKEFTNFTNRRAFETDDPFFANAISIVKDEQWKRLRAIVTPTFAAGKLKRMKGLIDDTVHTLERNFNSALEKGNLLNVKQLYGAFTMDTIIQVAFGTKIDSLVEKDNPIILNAKKLFSVDMSLANIFRVTLMIMTPKLANFMKIRLNGDVVDYFTKFSYQVIDQKRKEMAAKKGKASSFIELLLEAEAEEETMKKQNGATQNGNSNGLAQNGHTQNGSLQTETEGENGYGHKIAKYITNDELMAQCGLFMLAGYDTTATTITMASYLLTLNPETQEKLYKEIITVMGKLTEEAGPNGPKDPVELVTIESLPCFEYLNGVVSETLRIYSPATFIEREASKDMKLATEDGRVKFNVMKGDMIQFPLYSMHRDPEQFPDPEAFRPERFVGEQTFHKYAYMPFGAGPRNCVAKFLALLEAKLALLHTVRQYKFSVAKETKIPPEFYYQSQIVVPKDIILKVERR